MEYKLLNTFNDRNYGRSLLFLCNIMYSTVKAQHDVFWLSINIISNKDEFNGKSPVSMSFSWKIYINR